MRLTAVCFAIASLIAGPAFAAGPANPSLYAVNSAAIASAMTYCSTRHGNLLAGSPGAACFTRARNILAGYGLKRVSQDIDARCNDPQTFNTCLTPEIGRLVHALNAEFQKQGL
ncbi:hypothetical protein [Pseudoxanthomonas putridarboris]|uniref:Cysteine rich repeat-containing protein n=1 Tax=Pseudoxanthomonas putridarboris TaxID=752605 RepID=A0ABU9IX19_9GAMM